MALVPLLWLALFGEKRLEWWWIAGAFSVSWLADTAAHWVQPWLISAVYPVSQTTILGAVLLDREEAYLLLVTLGMIAIIAVSQEGVTGPTVMLRTVAWGAIVGIVWRQPLGMLRSSLLMAFGVGWITWIGYTLLPGWVTWGIYQSVRAVSLGLFCWASRSRPILRIV